MNELQERIKAATESKLHRFDVFVRDITTDNKWSMTFQAENFGEAETLAKLYIKKYDEIIRIEREWE